MALLVLDFVVECVCGAGFMVLFEHGFVVALVILCRDVFAVMCFYGLMVLVVHGFDFKFVCGSVFEVAIVSLGGGVEARVTPFLGAEMHFLLQKTTDHTVHTCFYKK